MSQKKTPLYPLSTLLPMTSRPQIPHLANPIAPSTRRPQDPSPPKPARRIARSLAHCYEKT